MTQAKSADWFGIGLDAWMLGIEMSSVIALRSARIMAGGALGEREAERMVSEKVSAYWEFMLDAATAGPVAPATFARRSVRHYRSKVRANRRRLGG